MKSERVKNIVISLLVILSIYQTVRLWFRDISGHSLFSTFLPNTLELSNVNIEQPFYTPYRIIYNPGNGEFKMTYQDINEKIKRYGFYDIMKYTESLSYLDSSEIDLTSILKRKSFIYQYNFPMETLPFLNSFGKSKIGELSLIHSFDTIVISPNRDILSSVTIYFLDSENNMAYSYSAKIKNSLYTQIESHLDEGKDFSGIVYESSDLKQWPIFTKNVFYPKWSDSGFEYKPLEVINPYLNSSGVETLNDIRQLTGEFFDNSVINEYSPFPRNGDETQYFIYSGAGQKVVKYYLNNRYLLEYTNFGDFSKYKNTSVYEDYNSAIRFVENDSHIVNDLYLNSYVAQENQRIFYFDYAINDFKILFSDKTAKSLGIEHHIEVTVENGMVVKYRKLALNYFNTDETASVTTTCEEQITDLQSEQEDLTIENIELFYKSEAQKTQNSFNNLFLHWWAFNKNGTVIKPA